MPQGTYLVTGAAGFIGSNVCTLLVDNGHRVIGVDVLNDAYDVRLKHWRLAQLEGRSGFEFHSLDICDRLALRQLMERQAIHVDGVLNLAARAGVRASVENPWQYVDANVTGTLNLLELCRDHRVNKFVLSSTSSLYGASNPRPYREDANTDGPLSPYAASKKAAEVMCYTYHHLYQLDVTVLRYFTVYGPAGRPDMSPFRFVQWISEGRPVIIYGDGTQQRDFTYVGDIARGTVAALKPLGYEVINLGCDQPVVLRDMLRLTEQLVGRRAEVVYKPAHPTDMMATWAQIDKAARLLDWRPEVSLERGLTQLVSWYQENRDWANQIATE